MAKVPADIRSLARGYTDVCIKTLGGIAKAGKNEQARISAAAILLDRGYGKAAQPVTGADGESDIRITIRVINEGTP
jgi:hypothetical protein